MKILVVSATAAEAPSVPGNVTTLITGVGMVATAAQCSQALARRRYDLALNVGVCGSFRPQLLPGAVVHVVADRMPELGAEDGDAFLTIHDLKLLGEDEAPYRSGLLVNPAPPRFKALDALPKVTGITVNTVHGAEDSIARVTERFDPDVETMEGAAFMYACLINEVPFAQIRAVSNLVERRNRNAWKMREAIEALAQTMRDIIAEA